MTKLETLVELLESQQIEKELRDSVIVEYYKDQYETEFLVGDTEYKIFSENEYDDALYELAEEITSTKLDELEAKCLPLQSQFFNQIQSSLSFDKLVEQIKGTLDEEDLAMSFGDYLYLTTLHGYYIFSNEG